MPNTTTPNFTALGAKNIKRTFALITSRHTVPISTQSNECGSLLESFASTTNISRLSQRLSRSSKPSSRNGQMAMSHLGAFVPSKYFAFIYVRVYRILALSDHLRVEKREGKKRAAEKYEPIKGH